MSSYSSGGAAAERIRRYAGVLDNAGGFYGFC